VFAVKSTAEHDYEVIADIREAKPILIFGPGEAKDALKARLEKTNLVNASQAL